jgi:DNA-binding MarR family transcriptional regulator
MVEQHEPNSTRAALLERVGLHLGRELSTHTVLFHETLADRLGITPTDVKCIGVIGFAKQPVTAGDLAAVTGLTSGAVTGIVDRLERAGFVRRERDPHDRRRVIITPLPSVAEKVEPLFDALGRAMMKLASGLSDHELAIVERYMLECMKVLREETARLRAPAPRDRRTQKRRAKALRHGAD